MTTAGWIFMIISVSMVIVLTAYCYVKVLRKPVAEEKWHAPLDIDTKDLDE